MSLNKKIINGSLWSLLGSSGYQLSGLVIFIILSRILSPVDFGTAALAIIFVELTNVLVRFGLEHVVIRSAEKDHDYVQNAVFVTTLLLGVITCSIFLFASPYLEAFFDAPGLAVSLQILSIVPVMQGLATTPNGILRRNFKFKALAIRLLASSIISGSIAIILACNGFGFYSLIIQKIISTSLDLLLYWLSISWRPTFKCSYSSIISMLKQGRPIVLSALIGQSIFRFVELLIGFFLGVAALGSFKIAGKLLDAIVQFTIKPIVDVSFSAFANLKDSPTKLEDCYLNFITTCTLFSFPAFIGALVIGSDMVDLIFGKQWETSGAIFSILCLGGISASLNYFFAQLCHATRNSHIPFRVRIIEFIAVLTLVGIFAQFSIYHVVYSNVAVSTCICIGMLVILQRKFSFSLSRISKNILPSFISALFMGGVVSLCLQTSLNSLTPILKVVISIVGGCTIYILFYRFVFPKKVASMITNIKKLRS